MRRFVIFLILMALVVCPYSGHMNMEERKKKRKKFQKEIGECILESNKISSQLRKKVEENKDEDIKKLLHLYTEKLGEDDREVIRKCRRKYFEKIRNMFREKIHERFNRNFTHHFPNEHEIHPFGPKHLRGNHSSNYSEHEELHPQASHSTLNVSTISSSSKNNSVNVSSSAHASSTNCTNSTASSVKKPSSSSTTSAAASSQKASASTSNSTKSSSSSNKQ